MLVVNHALPAKIGKIKDLTLSLLISVFSPSTLTLCQKTSEANIFIQNFYLQPFNEMFLFNNKSDCDTQHFDAVGWATGRASACKQTKNSATTTKVIEFGTNQMCVCNFLLVTNSNVGPISPHFRDIAGFLLRTVTPPIFHRNFGSVPIGPDCRCWGSQERTP